jgi:hypothetical protein
VGILVPPKMALLPRFMPNFIPKCVAHLQQVDDNNHDGRLARIRSANECVDDRLDFDLGARASVWTTFVVRHLAQTRAQHNSDRRSSPSAERIRDDTVESAPKRKRVCPAFQPHSRPTSGSRARPNPMDAS